MRACVIQPPYSYDEADLKRNFECLLNLLDQCDPTMDLIVLPEYSDVLADAKGKGAFLRYYEENNARLLSAAADTARRCSAVVFVNAFTLCEGRLRNTTHAFDRSGREVGRYFKEHPAPSEVKSEAQGGHGLDVTYSYLPREPYIMELDGVRYAFLTCYDFYFYEYFPRIAKAKPDIIIGCSLQRTDTHEALSVINRFLCYQTNAYLVRASVSLGEDSPLCGTSCIVTPRADVLVDMESRVGLGVADIEISEKHYKPAGFGGSMRAHWEYVEEGRRPWLYRNGGTSVVPFDSVMPYPRLCAHRGYNVTLPENTMPAFGAAVALGAEEIEFDLWATSDGVLVSCHDATLERVSTGEGKIWEHTYAELSKLDFGVKHDARYRGLKIARFEDILRAFASRVVMNIHVKIWDMKMERDMLSEIVSLIRRYDAERHCYFMSTNDTALKKAREYAPEIGICVGWDGNQTDMLSMVKRAKAIDAYKIQLFKPYFNEETVREAHRNGILCNVFYADTPSEAITYREMGIDTILTNDYLSIREALENEKIGNDIPTIDE